MDEVLKLYANLTGRKLEGGKHEPATKGTFNFTTQTALGEKECDYALQVLLGWCGLRIIQGNDACFRVEPASGQRDL